MLKGLLVGAGGASWFRLSVCLALLQSGNLRLHACESAVIAPALRSAAAEPPGSQSGAMAIRGVAIRGHGCGVSECGQVLSGFAVACRARCVELAA